MASGNNIPKRRVHERCEIPSTQVVFTAGDERFLGFARNVSRTGIFVHTVRPCREGEEYTIEFTIPDTNTSVKCRTRVAWCKNPTWIKDGISSEGLAFIDIDPMAADRLGMLANGRTA